MAKEFCAKFLPEIESIVKLMKEAQIVKPQKDAILSLCSLILSDLIEAGIADWQVMV